MPKVTKVAVQKYNKHRYSVFLDEEYAFSLDEDTLVKHEILKGKELEKEYIETVLLSEEKIKARNAAVRFLGYRMRTEKEVLDKLSEKGYSDFAEEVIDYLKENNYLDDFEFAVAFCRDKMRLSGFGKNRLKLELRNKGVDDHTILMALEEACIENSEFDNALGLAEKRMGRSYKSDGDRYNKIYAYLYRKGYAQEVIKRVMDSLK